MIPTTFPEVLDSTMITTYRSCPQKFFLEYCQHWKTSSIHLRAGAAFAKGLEVARLAHYRDGKGQDESLDLGMAALLTAYGDFECPEDSPKSATRMAGALEFYFERYPFSFENAPPHIIEATGEPAVEFNFAEPLPLLHPTTGNPLILAGRFDQIVDYAGGLWGEDDKTASQLGATWPKQWDMRFQFSTYCWGARQAGLPLQGFLVRGISILKRGYDTLQAITYRPEWMLQRWEVGMLQTVRQMVENWEVHKAGIGVWALNEGDTCNAYGGCPFRTPCLSESPQPWLESGFTQRIWNPLTRSEEGVL